MKLLNYFFSDKKKKDQVKAQAELPAGFKAVAPPTNPGRRRLMEGEDLTASGGCRTVRIQHA